MLKKTLARHLQSKRQTLQSEGQLLKLDKEIKQSTICKLTDRIIACTSDAKSEVYTIMVSSNGHFLCGSVSLLLPYPEEYKRVQSMYLGSQNYLFLADTKCFWKFNMAQKTLERVVVLQSDPASILRIQGIRKIMDCQIGTIKLVTKLEGTIEFLQNLGNLYHAFSVHHKHQEHKICTLKEALQMVKAVSSNCDGTIEDVKESSGIKSTTNGPQGTIAAKTAASLNLLEKGL